MSPTVVGHLADGRAVRRVTIGSAPGPVLTLLDLGATVERLEVTGGDGLRHDIVLTLPGPADYLASREYVGATLGRTANRIAQGRFDLDGEAVRLLTNEGPHHLHGGPDGFARRTWELADLGPTHALLRLISPDGDQGYPGQLTVEARFAVHADRVALSLSATTDASTIVNLSNHAYFDLGPDTVLTVPAEEYAPVRPDLIPTGEVATVSGTPYDLRSPRLLADLDLDHHFVIGGDGLRSVALLESERAGLRIEVRSDQPGLQVYTGNPLGGVALEAQGFPDAPHHPGFPSIELRPGETYRATIEWVVGALGSDFTAPDPLR